MDVSADLQDLATECEGFSGADLQALLYNAQLDAIHFAMADVPAKTTLKDIKFTITKLEGSLREHSDIKQRVFPILN